MKAIFKSPEYTAWRNMRQRCRTPTNPDYKNYGARNITICARWDSFKNFLTDMGPRPSPIHTLERVNNYLNYTPLNCKWVTQTAQHRNTRTTKLTLELAREIRALFLSGVPAEALARAYGVCAATIWYVARGQTWKEGAV